MNSPKTPFAPNRPDAVLKRQLKNWAADQSPPSNIRGQVIRAAAKSERKTGLKLFAARFNALAQYNIGQVTQDSSAWLFTRLMTQNFENDLLLLRVVS